MKRQSQFKTIIITILILGVFPLFSALYVNAQEQVPVCSNPGPYQICIPDTDVAIGSVVISNEVLAIAFFSFTFGLLYVMSGFRLKNKLSN